MKAKCPACETTFRISVPQLRAKNGLVRCGDCQDVFNAAWHLVDDLPTKSERKPVKVSVKLRHSKAPSQPVSRKADPIRKSTSANTPPPAPTRSEPTRPAPAPSAPDPATPTPAAATAPQPRAPDPLPTLGDVGPGFAAGEHLFAVDPGVRKELDLEAEPDESAVDEILHALDAGTKSPSDAKRRVNERRSSFLREPRLTPVPTSVGADEGGNPKTGTREGRPRAKRHPFYGEQRSEPRLNLGESHQHDVTSDLNATPSSTGETAGDLRRSDVELPRQSQRNEDQGEVRNGPGSPAAVPPQSEAPALMESAHAAKLPSFSLLWLFGSLLLIIVLGLQTRFVLLDSLAQITPARATLEHFCRWVGCDVPPVQTGPSLRVAQTRVDLHPQVPGAIAVRLHLINRGSRPQPYPHVQLTLTDREGAIVGRRTFSPNLYARPASASDEIAPGVLAVVTLTLVDTSENAVGFEAAVVAAP